MDVLMDPTNDDLFPTMGAKRRSPRNLSLPMAKGRRSVSTLGPLHCTFTFARCAIYDVALIPAELIAGFGEKIANKNRWTIDRADPNHGAIESELP